MTDFVLSGQNPARQSDQSKVPVSLYLFAQTLIGDIAMPADDGLAFSLLKCSLNSSDCF